MNATSASGGLPFNPAVMRWARVRRETTVEEAAETLKVDPAVLLAWEEGAAVPSVRQARALASFYGRSFLEFFLPQPPIIEEGQLVPDFRLYRSTGTQASENRDLLRVKRWAESTRDSALDLIQILGEDIPTFPGHLHCSIEENVEAIAARVREAIGPDLNEQMSTSGREPVFLAALMRRTLEAAGILALRDGRLQKLGIRGLCLYASPLPVIVFGTEAPAAQAFTMAHELGHVVLRQSGISGSIGDFSRLAYGGKVEDWCNKFAGSYLIPATAINALWSRPNTPVAAIGDDFLQSFSKRFKVSRHAMMVRLVHLRYVEPEYYWNVKKPEFDTEERDYKSFGRPKFYANRFRSACGDFFTGLVLEAWGAGAITNHNAAEFMGTKDVAHMEDLKREFVRS